MKTLFKRAELLKRFKINAHTLNKLIENNAIETEVAGKTLFVPEEELEKLEKLVEEHKKKVAISHPELVMINEARRKAKELENTKQEGQKVESAEKTKASKPEDSKMAEQEARFETPEHKALRLEIESDMKDRLSTLNESLADVKRTIDGLKTAKEELSTSVKGKLDKESKPWEEFLNTSVAKLEEAVGAMDISRKADEGTLKTELEQQVKAVDAKIATLPSEERVRQLFSECVADPEGPGCKLLAKNLGLEKAPEEEPAEAGEDEHEGVIHEHADDFLSCPTCRDAFSKAIKARIGDYIDDETVSRVSDILGEKGFTVAKKEEKKEKPSGSGF